MAATGFTGSKHAGLKLKAAADRAGKPIYLEMSSINPVFVLPRALDERGAAIAEELSTRARWAGSVLHAPGVTVVQNDARRAAFVGEVAALFGTGTPGTLLGRRARAIAEALEVLVAHGAGSHRRRAVDGGRFVFEHAAAGAGESS